MRYESSSTCPLAGGDTAGRPLWAPGCRAQGQSLSWISNVPHLDTRAQHGAQVGRAHGGQELRGLTWV